MVVLSLRIGDMDVMARKPAVIKATTKGAWVVTQASSKRHEFYGSVTKEAAMKLAEAGWQRDRQGKVANG
jgi:hypothetical protein